MDFAKDLLMKYGWEEGKGLGRNQNGIATPILPALKFDNAGLGHNHSEEFTNEWWDRLYAEAVKNIKIKKQTDGSIKMNRVNSQSVEITNKTYSLKDLKKGDLEYGSFLKTSKLTEKGLINLSKKNVETLPTMNLLTDQELFAACGGRTAHKAARHGLKLSGKLARLEKQEKLLLKKLKTVSISDNTETKCKKSIQKKLKKLNDHKDRNQLQVMDENSCQSLASSPSSSTSGKKHRKPKRVSFSEVVTEYQSQEPDSDLGSRPTTPVSSKKQVKIKEVKEGQGRLIDIEPNQSADEGIDCCDDIKSKVKQEHRMMKRSLKMLRKNRQEPTTDDVDLSDGFHLKCLKRKIGNGSMAIDSKRYHYEDRAENREGKVQTLSKRELRKLKKEKRMQRKINKVAQSLDHCKIGDSV